MTTTLTVSFVLGRYHATPWGRHVNEGTVELPPSPWRLLRALYAVWKTRAPELDQSTVEALLARLAEPPTYYIPPFRLAHTRHYYPDSTHHSGPKPSVDRTLDAFAVFSPNTELAIQWSFDLEPEEHKALQRLASSLPYLGRADSICEARVVDEWEPTEHEVCSSQQIAETIPPNQDFVRVLCPTTALDIDALIARPIDIRAGKLLYPPATQFVAYPQPQPTRSISPIRKKRAQAPITAVRFSILNHITPSLTDAVTITDRLRKAAISALDKHPLCSYFSGKTDNSEPLTGHQHPHYLALPNDQNNRIEELAIWIPEEHDNDFLLKLSTIEKLYGPQGERLDDISVRLSGYGPHKDIIPEFSGTHSTWISATPFAATGYKKPNHSWEKYLHNRVNKELSYRQMPAATTVEFSKKHPDIRIAAHRPFRSGLRDPTPAWLQLEFDKPVAGPIILGRLAHFGLGLFHPK